MPGVRGCHISCCIFNVSSIQEPLGSSRRWEREGRPICDKVPFLPCSSLSFTHSTMKLQPQKQKSASYQEWPAEMLRSAIAA